MFRKREESTGEGRMSATGGTEHSTSSEGRASATRNVPTSEGAATHTSATGGIEAVPRRGAVGTSSSGVGGSPYGTTAVGGAGIPSTGSTTGVGSNLQISDLDRRVDDLERRLANLSTRASTAIGTTGAKAGRRVAEIRDVTSQRLGEAGEAVGDAATRASMAASRGIRDVGSAVSEGLEQVEIEEFKLRGNVAGHPFSLDLEDEGEDRFLNFEVNLRTDQGDNIRISGRKNLNGLMSGGRSDVEGVYGTPLSGNVPGRELGTHGSFGAGGGSSGPSGGGSPSGGSFGGSTDLGNPRGDYSSRDLGTREPGTLGHRSTEKTGGP